MNSEEITVESVITSFFQFAMDNNPVFQSQTIILLSRCIRAAPECIELPQIVEVATNIRPLLLSDCEDLAISTCVFIMNVSEPAAAALRSIGIQIYQALAERMVCEKAKGKTSLSEHIAGAMSCLGGAVLGEEFPFAEGLPLIVGELPFVRHPKLYSEVFAYIPNVIRFMTPELQNDFFVSIIHWLSEPLESIYRMRIDQYILGSVLRAFIAMYPREEVMLAAASEALEGDEVRMRFFMQSFMALYRETGGQTE